VNRILHSHKLIGLMFITLMIASIWFTYAIFTKKFVAYDEVSLKTSKIGLQLPSRADVKIRGVIIGEVLDASANQDGAELTLGIYPDKIKGVPRNVTAQIEPKTLFGEKYVALQVPDQPASQNLAAGDVITQTQVAHEVEETLNDLYPLLRAVQPAELNKTLNAMATALEGRGEAVGNNLEVLDAYLKRINPELPALVQDISLLADTSDLYADVVPEIATTLRNSVTTGKTLVGREAKLTKLFRDVSAFSDTTRTFLAANGDNLIRVNQLGAQIFKVLAKYSPEFPCLIHGIVKAGALQAEAFRGFILHINLELLPHQPRGYNVNDKPRYGDKRGPYCGGLPSPPGTQAHPFSYVPNINDGVDEPTGKGTTRVAPGWSPAEWYVGSKDEAELIRQLLGASTGRRPGQVSDLGVLLFGPIVRGTEVSLR
jgi:phospholipid/cholesterol/gamma-HCH transport system substrate-binding protein